MSTRENRSRANNLAVLTFAAVVALLALVFPASRAWAMDHATLLVDDMTVIAHSVAIAVDWFWNGVIMPIPAAIGRLF